MAQCKGYPLCGILITIAVLTLSSTANKEKRETKNLLSPSLSQSTPLAENRPINVPMSMCDSSEQKRYADLKTAFLDPPCEDARGGYCGLRGNQNYTFIAKFLAKVPTKSLAVRITNLDPTFGWETPVWPEFSVCSGYNITCPQNANNLVEAYLHQPLPSDFPAMRGVVRVRLLGTDVYGFQKVYICRQMNIHVY